MYERVKQMETAGMDAFENSASRLGGLADAQQESEVSYAMRSASENFDRLQKSFDQLLRRIEPALRQEPPSPAGKEVNHPSRGVSSPLACALSTHATEIENLEAHIRGVTGRVAL